MPDQTPRPGGPPPPPRRNTRPNVPPLPPVPGDDLDATVPADARVAPRRGSAPPPPPPPPTRRVAPPPSDTEDVTLPGERVMPRFDGPTARAPVSVMLGVDQDVDLDDDGPTMPHETATATSGPPARQTGSLPGRRAVNSGRAAAGRYRIDDEIARGGMGAILRAFDQDVRREIAMKVMLKEKPSKNSLARFLEEGQVTGQLEHPNIVPVYEVGLDAMQRLYFTMKLVRGRSLKQRLAEAREQINDGRGDRAFTLMERVEVFRKICDGLAFAHSRGVIHRDLKPDNVMVGQFGEVQVMDWGLAKIIGRAETHGDELVVTDRSEDDDVGRTREGSVAGTPAYMPPEQAAGKIELIDERSDIYSLGAILYELLTFAKPFVGSSLVEILSQVRKGSLVPPTERVVTEFSSRSDSPAPRSTARTSRSAGASARLRGTGRLPELPNVPRELEAVVLKAMARKPAERYRKVMDLRADVDAWLEGRTVQAADYSSWQLLSKWVARNKALVVGSAAVLLVAVIGLFAVFAVAGQKEAEARQAKIDAAEKLYRDADAAWESAATTTPFNPAAPHVWFQSALPPLMEMGRALQQHIVPPAEWREAVAERSKLAQRHALETANWALAVVLAESAGTWGAVDDDERKARLAMVSAEREAVAERDRKRLDDALDRVRRATAGPGAGGALVPGELEERARLIARNQGGFLTGELLKRLTAQPAAGAAPEQVALERRFLMATLGQTGDAISAHDGKTAPQLLTGRLRTAVQKPDARSTDEVASAVAALAHIAAVAPASVKNVDGLLTSVRDAFGPGPVSIAVNDALEYLRIDRDNGELPNRADNPEGYATQVRLLGDHVASAVRSGRAYTAALLERLTTKRNDVPAFVFLINALGLHGDIDPPDPSKPDVAAVQWLEQSLKTVPGEMLTRYRPNGVADATWRSHRDAAGSMALALARLGRSETRSWLASRLRDLSHGELQSALELSWALLGGIHRSSPDAPTNQPTDADGWARLAARALDSKDYGVALDAANRGLALDPRHVRSLFERGQILERLGYYDDALRDLDAAVAIQPEANAVWAFRAETLRQMGRLDEALESANRAMKLQSGEFSALLYRARIYREMGRVDEALADLDAVLTRDEGDAATLIEKADIFEELGRFDEARQVCDTLVRLLPNNDRSWSERAQLRMALGDPEGALEDYARALELAPDSGMYVVNRALARDDIGDHEGARVDLEAWLERHPDDALAMNNLGLVLINLGQIERARALLMKATPLMQPDVTDVAGIVEYTIKAGPRPMGFHQIQAASHHFAAGRFEAAEYLARVATRRNPQYATAWHILANSRMGRGICDQEVLDALDQAVRLEPTNPDHRLWRSEARRKNGDLRGAIEDADVALRSPDPSIRYDAYVNRGIARSMSDDAAGAISDYSEAIKLDGTRFNAFNLRGELFSRAGQLDEAMRDHDRAVACADADATAWGNRGITLNALERYDEAIESYTRSLELDPTSTLSLLNRGVSYHRSGRYQQAIADYTRGLQIDPDDEMMHTYRGLTLQAMGRWQDALKDFEAILRNDPDNPNGRLGRSAIRMDHQDDLRGALDDLTVALRSVPENVNAWHNRALVYLRLGEYAHAISDLDRVMTLTPDNEQALLLRAQLRNMTGEFQLGAADAQRARKLEPTDGEAWSCESAALLGLNKLAEAYTVSMQGFRAVTDGGTQGQWYNHACVCGRIATAREAGANPGAGAPDRKAAIDAGIDALDKAVQLGFNNGAHMDSDTDLDGLRKDPRFAAIRARAR